MRTRVIEQVVFNPPEGMEDWRNFRIEYGENGPEGLVWLPPEASAEDLELFLRTMGMDWKGNMDGEQPDSGV